MNNIRRYEAIKLQVNFVGKFWWLAEFDPKKGSIIRNTRQVTHHIELGEEVKDWEQFLQLKEIAPTKAQYDRADAEMMRVVEEPFRVSTVTPRLRKAGYLGPGIYYPASWIPIQPTEGRLLTPDDRAKMLIEQGQLEFNIFEKRGAEVSPATMEKVGAEGPTNSNLIVNQEVETKQQEVTDMKVTDKILIHEAEREHWLPIFLAEKEKATAIKKYNGVSIEIRDRDNKPIPGLESTLHGVYEDLYRERLLVAIRLPQHKNYWKAMEAGARSLAHRCKGEITYLPTAPEKALNDNLALYFKGSKLEFNAWLKDRHGIEITLETWRWFRRQPEKAVKYLLADKEEHNKYRQKD